MDLKLVFGLLLMALVCHTMAYELEETEERTLEEGILKQLLNLRSRSQEHEKRDPNWTVWMSLLTCCRPEVNARAISKIAPKDAKIDYNSLRGQTTSRSNGCYFNKDGSDYRGRISTTETGKTCQKWTAQSPHSHSRTPANYRSSNLGDHNYCRNPDGEETAWCYTTSSGTRWDYCDIGRPKCVCYGDDGNDEANLACMTGGMVGR